MGVLELFRRETMEFDYSWIRYAETVATQTAIAIDNSTALQQFAESQPGFIPGI